MTGDAVWSFSVAIGTLLVAIVSPSLGVIADRRRIKMWWLRILTYVGAGGTLLLAFAPVLPIDTQWLWLMVCFMLANIGLNGAGVFYNALLPHMGGDDEMDRISNLAFAYGYAGGGILLIVHLAMVLLLSGDWIIPFVMASSAAWWYGFALLTFKWVPEPPIKDEMDALGFRESAGLALKEIRKTISEVHKFRTLFIYMLAYFFFIDGINSVTALGGIFGTTVLGVTTVGLIGTIVLIQLVGAPSAIGFTVLAKKLGTKSALNLALVGWVVLCFAALSFAPLEYSKHSDYQVQIEEIDGEWHYTPHSGLAGTPIAVEEGGDEQLWAAEILSTYGIAIIDDNYKDSVIYKWAGFDENDTSVTLNLGTIDAASLESLMASFEDTRFSISQKGGVSIVGIDHPTNLGDGKLDFIPKAVRSNLWEPLGLNVTIQFAILGTAMGTLLGGSQGLARSLFGQMVPESRSAEFFGFFGFFGKVAAFIGPLLYGLMTVMFDSRVGILSIAMLILIGAVMMRWVDVDQGRKDAMEEDARNRGIDL
jgi:MFS-type transporter involved in bile tolerance (Atg22 family)